VGTRARPKVRHPHHDDQCGGGAPEGGRASHRHGVRARACKRLSVVRLTLCPLLEAAHKHPDVVCGVHLGIVRGALEEYGADPTGTDLLPFSEPGACRLELLARPADETR